MIAQRKHSRFLSCLGMATIAALLVLASASTARGQVSLAVLHSFAGPPMEGAFPLASVMQANDGMLYGTTEQGGPSNLGAIFKVGTDGGNFAMLHSFTGPDGADVWSGLIQVNGLLYGTTRQGGSSDLGTIFKMATDGSGFTVVHNFTAGVIDGAQPSAPLMQASDGMLYGTTETGGTNGEGTVFRMSPDGSDYTILYSFSSAPGDGDGPLAGLMQADDGMLYGTTVRGGTNNLGTVFKIALDGTGYTVLHNFTGPPTDGMGPIGVLMQASNRTLYGTAVGQGGNPGTIYQITLDGSNYAVLHNFPVSGTDGATPHSGLLQDGNGILYGTTVGGGTSNNGTAFQMAPDGSGFSILVSFGGSPSGRNPYAALLPGGEGIFYGTTAGGGGVGADMGTVFQLTLSPSAPTRR